MSAAVRVLRAFLLASALVGALGYVATVEEAMRGGRVAFALIQAGIIVALLVFSELLRTFVNRLAARAHVPAPLPSPFSL